MFFFKKNHFLLKKIRNNDMSIFHFFFKQKNFNFKIEKKAKQNMNKNKFKSIFLIFFFL